MNTADTARAAAILLCTAASQLLRQNKCTLPADQLDFLIGTTLVPGGDPGDHVRAALIELRTVLVGENLWAAAACIKLPPLATNLNGEDE